MRRDISLPIRLAAAGTTFGVAFVAAIWASHLSFGMRQGTVGLGFAAGALLAVWCLLAYFPARTVYLALTYRHFRDGIHCEGCGYDLTGNRSGVCPECGRPLVQSDVAPSSAPDAGTRAPSRSRKRRLASWASLGVFCGGVLLIGDCVLYRWGSSTPRVVSDDFELVDENVPWFVQWRRGHEMRELEQSSIYAVASGEMPLRLAFDSPKRRSLVSVGITDTVGRAWIDIDRNKGTYNVTVFPADDPTLGAAASRTYIDSDGDGITDTRLDWQDGQRYRLDLPIRWVPQAASPEQSEEGNSSRNME